MSLLSEICNNFVAQCCSNSAPSCGPNADNGKQCVIRSEKMYSKCDMFQPYVP